MQPDNAASLSFRLRVEATSEEAATRWASNMGHSLALVRGQRYTARRVGATDNDALFSATDVSVVVDGHNLLPHPVSLSLGAGDVVALSGPSGSGKSTLLRALALIEPRAKGRVALAGVEPKPVEVPRFRRRVVYVAQRSPRWPLTVEQSLSQPFRFGSATAPFDRSRAVALCEELQLPDDVLSRELRDLSGGEAQRVSLVRALLIEPSVLLLDEPTSALDSDAATAVREQIQAWLEPGGRAVIVASHDRALGELVTSEISLQSTEVSP